MESSKEELETSITLVLYINSLQVAFYYVTILLSTTEGLWGYSSLCPASTFCPCNLCQLHPGADLLFHACYSPCQQILSKDSVTVAVDAVVYYRISNATISVTNVEDANRSTRLLAQTTLRNVLGTKNLSEILSDREQISHFMQVSAQENLQLNKRGMMDSVVSDCDG